MVEFMKIKMDIFHLLSEEYGMRRISITMRVNETDIVLFGRMTV